MMSAEAWSLNGTYISTSRNIKKPSSSIGKHFRDKHCEVPKDLSKNFTVLKKCKNKFYCLVYMECFILMN